MATQFAINEPDSFSSANQTYTSQEVQVYFGLDQPESFEINLIPDDVLFGFGAIDFIGDYDYFDIPLPALRSRPFLPWSFFGNRDDRRHRQRRQSVRRRAHVVRRQELDSRGDGHEPRLGGDVPAVQRREHLLVLHAELQDNGNDQTGG